MALESDPTPAAARIRYCGASEPHRPHEWIDGALRVDCPGYEPSPEDRRYGEQALRESAAQQREWPEEQRQAFRKERAKLLREVAALCREQGISLSEALDEFEASRVAA